MFDTKESLQILQIVATMAGFSFAVYQLRQEYLWRRKQYAVNMLAEWNRHTANYRKIIEKFKPGLLDQSGGRKSCDLSYKEAEGLYLSTPADQNKWELRYAIVELLNYCEYIAVSETQGIGESGILKDSFCHTVFRWYLELQPYVVVTAQRREKNPWTPLTNAVKQWIKRCWIEEKETRKFVEDPLNHKVPELGIETMSNGDPAFQGLAGEARSAMAVVEPGTQ